MFKRTRETIRSAAESAGILNPSVADATQAAEDRRQTLIEAEARVNATEAELEAAYDRGASPRELAEIEARYASAEMDAKRAQKHHESAERTLKRAQTKERERGMVQGREQRDKALAERAKVAGEIAASLAGLKESLARLDSADARLSALQSAGHVRNASFGPQQSHARISVAVDDILSGTTAPRLEPFNVWIEYQNDTARAADAKPQQPAPVESVAQRNA